MRKSTIYIVLITALFSCIYSMQAYAGTCWNGGYEGTAPWYVKDGPGGSDSVAYNDVNYCVNTVAIEGDTVHVPAGSATWTSRLNITKGVILKGAGIDKTILVNGIITTGSGDFLIYIKPAVIADNPHVEITGFTLNANSDGGAISLSCRDKTYAYSNFRIHHNKIENTLDDGDSYMSIRTKGDCFGLIDNNQFVDNRYDFKIYGDDQNSWDDYPGIANVGSANYLYIENNTSVGVKYFILTSGEGARWVYRYNTVDISSLGSGNGILDVHGNTRNNGVVAHEAYENNYTGGYSVKALDLRGGTAIDFNNKYELGSGCNGVIQIREEDCYQYGTDCTYPGIDPISNAYLWNNRKSSDDSLLCMREADDETANMIEQNRDYWTDGKILDYFTWKPVAHQNPNSEFNYNLAVNRPATCADDDVYWETDAKKLYRCEGANNWVFIYKPYTYPHPLTRRPAPAKDLRITD